MEPIQTRKTIVILLAVVALAMGVALAVKQFPAKKTEPAAKPQEKLLGQLVKNDLPVLDLSVHFITAKGEDIPAPDTRLGEEGKKVEAKDGAEKKCPDLVGGDNEVGLDANALKKRGENCETSARWSVKKHPIGLSLYFQNSKEIAALFAEKSWLSELLQNRFFQGIFHEPLRDAGIRAEDLHLDGLQGAFLRTLVFEALGADAALHYDIAHGKQGFIFSFVGEKCAYFSNALPIMAKVLVRSAYRIPSLTELILEMRIGQQRLFLTRVDGRVYLANGLEALINVLESLPTSGKVMKNMPLVLTLRSQAFVTNILPTLTGSEEWEMQLGFSLSDKSVGQFTFPAGKLVQPLTPKIYKGVPASIPSDVFAALVTSYSLPPEMTEAEWRKLATDGPDTTPATDRPSEGGFALIWDLDAAANAITQMGVVIGNNRTPEAADKFKKYFRHKERTAECGGGAVFLAATSDRLLRRMKESCNGQSTSIINWQNNEAVDALASQQLFFAINPGTGFRELFLAGGGASGGELGDFAPQWKKEYEKAKTAMRQDGEKAIGSLPIFAYSGSAKDSAKTVVLQGIMVKQGGAR